MERGVIHESVEYVSGEIDRKRKMDGDRHSMPLRPEIRPFWETTRYGTSLFPHEGVPRPV